MVRLNINVGANANDGTGDDLRTAMQKINTNFTELYGTTAEANDLVEDITPQLGGDLDLRNFILTTSLTNGNVSLQPNGTGSVLLKNIRITDNVISSDDSTSITIDESLAVTGAANFAGTLSAPTVVTNVIQSDDSSIIVINDGLEVAGSVKSTGVITNTLSSEDSSAIQVGDSLNVSGTVTASTLESETVNTSELNINDNQILAYNSNSDIILSTSGTGAIDVDGARIKNVAAPSDDNDAVSKSYLEGYVASGAFANNISFVGDDSTGTAVTLGETFKIAGSGTVTTAVSGDTLTITGAAADLGDFTFSGNKLSTTSSNADMELSPAGTGDLVLKSGDLLPNTNNTQYLGSTTKRWHTLYLGPGSLDFDGAAITQSGGVLNLPGGFRGTQGLSSIVLFDESDLPVNGLDNTGTAFLFDANTVFYDHHTYLYIQTAVAGGGAWAGWQVGDPYPSGELSFTPATFSHVYNSAGELLQLTLTNGGSGLSVAATDNVVAFRTGDPITTLCTLPYAGILGTVMTDGSISDNLTSLGTITANGTFTANNESIFFDNVYLQEAAEIVFPDNTVMTTAAPIGVVGDDSTGTTISPGETLVIQGSSNVTVSVADDSSATGDSVVTITGPDLTPYATTSSLNAVTSNIMTVVGDDSTGTTFNAGETLKIAGGVGISTAVSGDVITISASGGGGGSIGDLVIEGQTITTGPTNADLTISPNGVGNINLDADIIRVGDVNTAVTITSNGTGNLTLQTNSENPTIQNGYITMEEGSSGKIEISPSQDGYLKIGNTSFTSVRSAGYQPPFEYGLSSLSQYAYTMGAGAERLYGNSTSTSIQLLGADPDDGTDLNWRGHQTELWTEVFGRALVSETDIPLDSSSRNSGIARSYSGGPIAMGIKNCFKNTNSLNQGYISETAILSLHVSCHTVAANTTLNFDAMNGAQVSFNLGFQGGSTTVDDIVAFLANGNYVSNGTTQVDNYYAFRANNVSEADNNYGIYIDSPDWTNYLGGLTIKDSSISAERSDENLTLSTSGTGKVVIDDTLYVDTVELNNISSADSSAIQINDAVNVSGTLTANTSLVTPSVVTNAISSSDSSSVTINDDLEVKSQLFVNTISSNDSSAIQILDNVECNANLFANDITGTVVQFGSSGSPVSTNQTINMSSGRHFELWFNADITCTLTNYTFSTVKTMKVENTSGSAKVLTFNGTYSTGAAISYSTTVAEGREILITLLGGKDNVLVGESSINVASDLFVNNISSPDSSAITINDAVNISGSLSVDTIDTNTISSGDGSTIQINDSVQISDNLTMGGLFTLYNRTVAQLSVLTPAAGTLAYCTDETGGAQPVFYDGTNWRRMTDRIVIS